VSWAEETAKRLEASGIRSLAALAAAQPLGWRSTAYDGEELRVLVFSDRPGEISIAAGAGFDTEHIGYKITMPPAAALATGAKLVRLATHQGAKVPETKKGEPGAGTE
jgi:hypothetical protein